MSDTSFDDDYDVVVVDEFDALAIQVKVVEPASPATLPSTPVPAASPLAPEALAEPAPVSVSEPTTSSDAPVKQPNEQPWHEAWVREKLGKYPAKTHARKVAKELGVKNGLVYLPGQENKQYEDSDMGYEFRQRRYFYYLSGADFAGCAVTYDIARDYLILWIPYTDPRTELWFGTTPNVEEVKARTHVDDVRYVTGLERFLHLALGPGSTLFVLHSDQTPKMQASRGALLIDTVKLQPAMNAARVVKTDYEVAMIRRANAVSSGAHRAVLSRLSKLRNEREVDAIFRGFSMAHGAHKQSYPVIAGAGPNASTLHYDRNNQPLEGRQLLLIDAGAEWDCYASDVTRTMPISGKFTKEAGAIYAIVERMQEACIARIKPGVVFYTLHLHACVVAIAELLKLGILHNGSASEIFARGTIAAFFPHGLGHSVGLECHDVNGVERLMLGSAVGSSMMPGRPRRGTAAGKREWVSPESLGIMYRDAVTTPPPYKGRAKLEKNMVVTIEPGIYFSRQYIQAYFLENPLHAKYINTDVLERYYDVGGVRIEDCILVTDKGHENLTTAPKGEEALRIINGS